MLAAGWIIQGLLWLSTIYVTVPPILFNVVLIVSGIAIAGATGAYAAWWPGARRQVWPEDAVRTRGRSAHAEPGR